ncbi:hypothetical protein TNCV_4921841 [Trichonephila clavipes]|nr:hypothetical protein TNCV_4921841 [Trichonephila clavipes]
MFDPSSFAIPTPLAHADASRNVLPRGGTSHPEDNSCKELQNTLDKISDWRSIQRLDLSLDKINFAELSNHT